MTQPTLDTPFDPSQYLYEACSVREMDRVAIEEHGVAGILLMKRAGRAVFSAVLSRWPDVSQLFVFCGSGNNGGDGYIVAALAKQSGKSVQLVELAPVDRLVGDAQLARQYALAQGVKPVSEVDFERVNNTRSVIVDALLGTGFKGALSDKMHEVIQQINATALPVVAVDLPSGLNADTGEVQGCAIRASMTLTFIGKKIGLYTGDGPDYCGDIVFDHLDVPEQIYAQALNRVDKQDGKQKGCRNESAERTKTNATNIRLIKLLSLEEELTRLPRRAATNHKGSHGHLLVVGGNRGMGGAALMAAMAAKRMGTGLVSVATHQMNISALVSRQPELMVRDASDTKDLAALVDRCTVIAIGPGLGSDDWAMNLLNTVVSSGKPMLLDADALNLTALFPDTAVKIQTGFKNVDADLVMTPHPGEASRLLGFDNNTGAKEVGSDRVRAVTQLQETFSGVQLLKGAGTLISDAQGIALCPYGNPGMGSGGMGDVLTGIISGLWCQGMDAANATRLGACLHAAAGDNLAQEFGQRGLLATDLIPEARRILNGV